MASLLGDFQSCPSDLGSALGWPLSPDPRVGTTIVAAGGGTTACQDPRGTSFLPRYDSMPQRERRRRRRECVAVLFEALPSRARAERERGAQRAVPSSLMWAVLHSSSSSVVVVSSSLASGRPPARRSSRTAHAHAHTQRWLWAPGTTHTTPRGHPTRAPHTLLARWHTRRRRRLS